MIKCTIISPTKKNIDENVEGIFLEALNGAVGILHNHVPMLAALKANSKVRLKMKHGEQLYTVGEDSFFQFQNNEAVVLTQAFNKEIEY